VRQQAADLIGRVAVVMKKCEEEQLMGHLGVVLYEYLGEEYPEVLGSILGALKVRVFAFEALRRLSRSVCTRSAGEVASSALAGSFGLSYSDVKLRIVTLSPGLARAFEIGPLGAARERWPPALPPGGLDCPYSDLTLRIGTISLWQGRTGNGP
jgi:hypothetical protein